MKQKVLVVVDMQNDFIDGALGTREAEAIVPAVCRKIEAAAAENTLIFATKDTHSENYMETRDDRFRFSGTESAIDKIVLHVNND